MEEPGGLQSTGSQESDRIGNQAGEQHLAPTLTAVNVPRIRHQGLCAPAQNWQSLTTTPIWSPELALHLGSAA